MQKSKNISQPKQLIILCGFIKDSSTPILIKHFPVFKRFTAVTFGYAISRTAMYIITSFGLIYLTDWLGHYGIWIIAFPVAFFWFKALVHYEDLERKTGNYPSQGKWQILSPLSSTKNL